MKCSGDKSHALRVATAPVGSSRRDLPFGFLGSSSDEYIFCLCCCVYLLVVFYIDGFIVRLDDDVLMDAIIENLLLLTAYDGLKRSNNKTGA